jgi:hypothetical protein
VDVLEQAVTCILANATQIAQVPSRKTDVNDAAWIAQLLGPLAPISGRRARGSAAPEACRALTR